MEATENDGVSVDLPSIRKMIWNGVNTLAVNFEPSAGELDGLAVIVEAAIAEVWDSRFPDRRFRAADTATGCAVLREPIARSINNEVDLVGRIAAALSRAGLRGTLSGFLDSIDPRADRNPTPQPTFAAVMCSAGAVVPLLEAPDYRQPRRLGESLWRTDTESFGALVAFALEWADKHADGPPVVGPGALRVRCRPEQAPRLLELVCAECDGGGLSFRSEGNSFSVQFGLDGYVLFHMTASTMSWEQSVQEMSSLLAGAAEHLDYGFVERSYFPAASLDVVMGNRRATPDGLGFLRQSHSDLTNLIPDVFGIQLLGPGHSQLRPEPAWTTRSLPAGRRLVTRKDLPEWLDWEPVSSEARERARAENAALLFTREHGLARHAHIKR